MKLPNRLFAGVTAVTRFPATASTLYSLMQSKAYRLRDSA